MVHRQSPLEKSVHVITVFIFATTVENETNKRVECLFIIFV